MDVYSGSAYLSNQGWAAHAAEALFYGTRHSWFEGSGPLLMAKSWFLGFERNLKALIEGRIFLRSQWTRQADILNRVMESGQPIVVDYRGERISEMDMCWFYLTRFTNEIATSDRPIFCDLGSGCARLAWVFKQAFPNSTIICCDLPETLIGASYRLSMAYPDSRRWYFRSVAQAREDLRNPSDYDFIFLPGFAMECLPDNCLDVATNTMSLSEMRLETIGRYLEILSTALRPGGIFYTVNRSCVTPNRGHFDIPLQQFPVPPNLERIRFQERFRDIDHFSGEGSYKNGEALFRKIARTNTREVH